MAKRAVRDQRREAVWRRAVQEQRRSGLTVRAFCRQRELHESAFYFWRRELARRQPAPVGFVPVRITEEPVVHTPGRIEIVLSGGQRVHVVAPVDRQALADVLAVLEGRSC